jgi:hypothetical protein
MTLDEILAQAKTLSPQERKELAKMLIDLMDVPQQTDVLAAGEHWGQSLNQLMDKLGPIEMKYPAIEDPVEWVKQLRADQRRRRLDEKDDNE